MTFGASVISAVTNVATVLAGIGWEPEIRGALTVAVGSAVLMGSVWMILVTNSGVRLGSLIALAGFFGWMFLMGILWWIYGIGWVGSLPGWEVREFAADPAGIEAAGIADAVTGPAANMPDTNCSMAADIFPVDIGSYSYGGPSQGCTPRAVELLMAYPGEEREQILQELINPQNADSRIDAIVGDGITNRDDVFAELLTRNEADIRVNVETANDTIPADDPRFKDASGIDAEVAALVERRNTRIDDITLSALAAVGPSVFDWASDAGHLNYGGWNLLSTAQSGEAVATADAALRENAVFGSGDAQFIILDTFQQGGKPKRTGDGLWDRVWHKITSTARITHPTNYAIVQAQYAVQQEAQPGQLPPQPILEPEAATVSVIMERNLGNLRLIPALMTIFSLLIFLACCLVLHVRDLNLRERLATGAIA